MTHGSDLPIKYLSLQKCKFCGEGLVIGKPNLLISKSKLIGEKYLSTCTHEHYYIDVHYIYKKHYVYDYAESINFTYKDSDYVVSKKYNKNGSFNNYSVVCKVDNGKYWRELIKTEDYFDFENFCINKFIEKIYLYRVLK